MVTVIRAMVTVMVMFTVTAMVRVIRGTVMVTVTVIRVTVIRVTVIRVTVMVMVRAMVTVMVSWVTGGCRSL